ncbi:MAG: hypothetical protein PUA68_00170 [Bacilli bacterium]|nr:hypothetical protein [Bacilli bacterium]
MKKKILFTLLVLFTLINVNAKEEYTRKTTMNINNSGSVNFEIKYLANNDFFQKYDVNKEELFDYNTYDISLTNKGYLVDHLYENDGSGIVISKTFVNVSSISQFKKIEIDLTDIANDNYNDGVLFQKKFGLFFNRYVGHFVIDYTKIKGDEDNDLNEIKKAVNSKYVVVLPNAAGKHNANQVNNNKKELTWDLVVGRKNDIQFEFKIINMTAVIIGLFIATIITIFIVVKLVKYGSRKVDEIQETYPKKEKKPKKKKEKKNQKINNNGFDDEFKEVQPELTKADVIPNTINNTNENMQQQVNQPVQQPIQQQMSQPIQQQMNQPVRQQMNNPKPDLMAPQQPRPDLMANQNNLFNKQPVNSPNTQQQSQTPDYTNVFNPTFDNFNNDKKE